MAAMLPPDLSAFGPDLVPLRALPGGHRNAVWLVNGPRDESYVAKSSRRTEAALAWLAPLQAAAVRAGFAVPALIPASDGRLVPNAWTLEPFVAGPMAQDLRPLSDRIAAFHRLVPTLPQRPGFASLPALLQQMQGGDVDLTLLPPPLVTRLRRAWQPFAATPCHPIHGDLSPGNILLGPDGPTLIDWDEARIDLPFLDLRAAQKSNPSGTPDQDRAHLALEIASCWQHEPDHALHLLARFDTQGTTSADQPVAKR